MATDMNKPTTYGPEVDTVYDDDDDDTNSIWVPCPDDKPGCEAMHWLRGPPTSPSGFYQWVNRTCGSIEEVIGEEERKEMMAGRKKGRQGCFLRVKPSWYKVTFDLKPLATTQKILVEIKQSGHWKNYAVFISKDQVHLAFKFDNRHVQEEPKFFTMLQGTVDNLVVDDGNEGELKQHISSMLLQKEWWVEGYYFCTTKSSLF